MSTDAEASTPYITSSDLLAAPEVIKGQPAAALIDTAVKVPMKEKHDQIAAVHPSRPVSQIYYDPSNSLRSVEDTVYEGSFTQSFQSLTLPGSATLNMPANNLLSGVGIRIVMPTVPANVSFPRGWGYGLIQRVDIRYGAASVLTLLTDNVYLQVMAGCETYQKRMEVLRLGGEEVLNPTSGPIEAIMHIPLAFSKIRALLDQLPYDANLSKQIITITVYMNSGTAVMGGTGAPAFAAGLSLLSATFWAETAELINKTDSLAREMGKNPSLVYSYPLPVVYDQPVPNVAGAIFPVRASITLVGLKTGELLEFFFMVVPRNNNFPTLANDVINPFASIEITDLRLEWNGKLLFVQDGKLERLYAFQNDITPSVVPGSLLGSGTTSPFTSTPRDFPFYRLSVSRHFGSVLPSSVLPDGVDFGTSQLTLQFSTGSAAAFDLKMIYWYQGVWTTKDGDCNVIVG